MEKVEVGLVHFKKYSRDKAIELPFEIVAIVDWLDEDCHPHRLGFPQVAGAREYLAKVLREGALYGGIVRTVPMNKCDALDPEIDGLDVRPAADAWLQRQIYGPGSDAKRLAMALGVPMEDLEEKE